LRRTEGMDLQRRVFVLALACLAGLNGCASPIIRSQRQASPDEALDFVVVVSIVPGRRERQHEVFVGIGKRGDNPAAKYLHAEYKYLLAGQLDWRVTWQSADLVILELFEYPEGFVPRSGTKGPEAREVAVLVFARDPDGEAFRQIHPLEETQRDVV
jgi:hypothetical protein